MASDQAITKTITIQAPAANVWAALTNPESIKEWLTENGTTSVLADWKIGSPILFRGTWHKIKYEDKGIILQFEPETILANFYWTITLHKIKEWIEKH